MQIQVYYEDTDSTGLVYHANYLKFCERARSVVFFKAGCTPQNNQGGFVVKDLQADFIAPALLGDCLQVSTQILELKKASLSLQQEIFRQGQKLFDLQIKLAFIDLTHKKPAPIPQNFLEILHGF
ncbi:Thioesterase family protein YbgC [Helicobacter sp. NHP19-003]|uniref:Thioesterase family protein YbgC n=1 Tax=Helicobacter gastrocanis TaxID=2849641 RepID=A0ABM7S9F6_9HELI|nr:YbgC/FadM family acyl-CoA thioesterase [Helicobacter sp. NHP19-003]BCZ17176.1 Thioesterase family protein YbgC [Helicobacter sp. NHP19-003]